MTDEVALDHLHIHLNLSLNKGGEEVCGSDFHFWETSIMVK